MPSPHSLPKPKPKFSLFTVWSHWAAAAALPEPFCLSPQTPPLCTSSHSLHFCASITHRPARICFATAPVNPDYKQHRFITAILLFSYFLSANGGCKQAVTQTDRVRQGVNWRWKGAGTGSRPSAQCAIQQPATKQSGTTPSPVASPN